MDTEALLTTILRARTRMAHARYFKQLTIDGLLLKIEGVAADSGLSSGSPISRTSFYAFMKGDRHHLAHDTQEKIICFLIGHRLLSAAELSGLTDRTLFLPKIEFARSLKMPTDFQPKSTLLSVGSACDVTELIALDATTRKKKLNSLNIRLLKSDLYEGGAARQGKTVLMYGYLFPNLNDLSFLVFLDLEPFGGTIRKIEQEYFLKYSHEDVSLRRIFVDFDKVEALWALLFTACSDG